MNITRSHLMFRDGLLSPRSKLLPQSSGTTHSLYSYEEEAGIRSGSSLSLASTGTGMLPHAMQKTLVLTCCEAGTTMTGLQKDPRDTVRRRVRHRDHRLLRAGMGLTTGLGWSDRQVPSSPYDSQ